MLLPLSSQPAEPPFNYRVSKCPVDRSSASHRIAIIRTGSSGDIIMTSPLLAGLRRSYPNAYITWFVEPKFADVLTANPFVDEIVLWKSGPWKRSMNRRAFPPWSWEIAGLKKRLSEWNFDVLISFHGEQFEWLTENCGAPIKIGFFDEFPQFDKSGEEILRKRIFTSSVTAGQQKPHRTDTALLALKLLNLPSCDDKQLYLGFTESDLEAGRVLLNASGLSAGSAYAVIAPFTTWDTRNWSLDKFASLGQNLQSNLNLRIVLIGSLDQKEGIQKLARDLGEQTVVAAGNLTLRQMAAVISEAGLLVSGDTGPMHTAAAVGTPYVALFGPTPAPGRAPLRGQGIIVDKHVSCAPCDLSVCKNSGSEYIQCMSSIGVDEVYRECEKLIYGNSGSVGSGN